MSQILIEKIIANKENYSSIKELSILIDTILKPTSDEQFINAEVSTPYFLRQKMLDTIPDDFWKDSKNKILEPTCGKGGFLLDVLDRFYQHNSDIKHIIENQIYFADINPVNVEICRFLLSLYIYDTKDTKDTKDTTINWFVGDSLQLDIYKQWNNSAPFKFDLIIGNPPYNTGVQQTSKTIYHYFVNKYINLTKYLCFVIPSRWFSGGKGLDKFRKQMLERKDIKQITHVDKSSEWFGKLVNITGGCNYFLKEEGYNGLCSFNDVEMDLSKFDILLKPLHEKLIKTIVSTKFTSLDTIYLPSSYYNVRSNDKRLKQNIGLIGTNRIVCYTSKMKSKTRILFIDKKDIEIPEEKKHWKVISPRTGGNMNTGFSHLTICIPESVFTHTYFALKVSTEFEAESLISYLTCKLPNILLMTRKPSMHIAKHNLKWIPLPPLDRLWDDKKIEEYFGIDISSYTLN